MIFGRYCFLLGVAVLSALPLGGCVVRAEDDIDSVADVSKGLQEPPACDPPAPEAAGCCPGIFELMNECAIFAITRPDLREGIEQVDVNADNYYCVHILRGGPPIFDQAFVAMDNKIPSQSANCDP